MTAKRQNLGFSIIEGLIALLICGAVMFFAIPTFHNSFQMVNTFERKGKCERVFNSVFNAIDLTPPEYRTPLVANGYWLPKIRSTAAVLDPANELAFEIPDDPIVRARFQRFNIDRLYQLTGPATVVSDSLKHNGVRLFTPLLLAGSMGYLGDLYGTGYCEDYRPVPDFLAGRVNDSSVKLSMRVLRQDVITKGIAADCGRFWPRARNLFNKSVITEPYSKYEIANFDGGANGWMSPYQGFLVHVKAEIADPEAPGGVVTCENQRSYSLPVDFHSVMDYLRDFKADTVSTAGLAERQQWMVRPRTTPGHSPGAGLPPDEFLDNTRNLVNKKIDIYRSTSPNLQTVFSNFYRNQDGDIVKERRECSQTGTDSTTFQLSFEVHNLRREPGTVAMCLDTSKNWLLTPSMQPWTWCQKSAPGSPSTPGASVKVMANQKSRAQGWVPCEALEFCGQKPDSVTVTPLAADAVRYQYSYTVKNDDNQSAGNRLWGCELKYGVSFVDPAGNLTYVPNRSVTAAVQNEYHETSVPSSIREVNPGVYFRPPNCQTCNCKPCKSKSLFGGFFSFLLLLVLIVATGGFGIFIEMAYFIGSFATLACLNGSLGCEKDPTYQAPDFDSAGYLACSSQNQGCSCGFSCRKVRPPGPRWIDDLDNAVDYNPDHRIDGGCTPETRQVTANGVTFGAQLAYKTYDGSQYLYSMEPDNKVLNGDEVAWMQFNKDTGMYCYAVHRCENNQFVEATEIYQDLDWNDQTAVLKGCYPVKTAHQILWNTKSDGKKPDRGPKQCLEIEYGPGIYNPSGDPLWGYNDAEYECAQDTGDENQIPTTESDPKRRYIGKGNLSQCADSYNVRNNDVIAGPPQPGAVNVRPAIPEKIINMNNCGTNDSGGAGGAQYERRQLRRFIKWAALYNLLDPSASAAPIPPSCGFACWASCEPPRFAPDNPLAGTEMRYYETYSPADSGLPFCRPLPGDLDEAL